MPQWLADGTGAEYNFAAANTYEIMAGRVNPLAVPFIPGDSDRDGDCDADDIAKIAAVFGNDDWVFSNSYATAPEGKDGDPANQTRPWDVDATGDNGIEASDLQWTLNFQGDTTGRIVGVQYDGPTPAATGVILNPNVGVECTVTASAASASGRPLSNLAVGDTVTVTIAARVTTGAHLTAGAENGVMQFVQDVALTTAGVLRVVDVGPLGDFATTRAAIQTPQGSSGDLGVTTVNGHTTSFAAGLSAPADLYEVTLEAVGAGATTLTVSPVAEAKFAASTPAGLKVGHTASNGNPASASYPAAIALSVRVPGDIDGDGDVDADDFTDWSDCMTGPAGGIPVDCDGYDLDLDGDVDLMDFGQFAELM